MPITCMARADSTIADRAGWAVACTATATRAIALPRTIRVARLRTRGIRSVVAAHSVVAAPLAAAAHMVAAGSGADLTMMQQGPGRCRGLFAEEFRATLNSAR